MKFNWIRIAPVLALAAAMGLAACDDHASEPLSPSSVSMSDGLLDTEITLSSDDGSTTVTTETSGTVETSTTTTVAAEPTPASVRYKIGKGTYNQSRRYDSSVLGVWGGTIGVGGHTLHVPAGVVAVPTLFEMRVAAAGADGLTPATVQLEAYQKDPATGQYTVRVGHLGFLKPVKLTMSYSWLSELGSDLRVVWLKTDGTQEAYQTSIDPSGKKITSYLNHFSEYGIGWPNRECSPECQ